MEAGTTEEAVAVVQARNTGSLVLVVLEKVVRSGWVVGYSLKVGPN